MNPDGTSDLNLRAWVGPEPQTDGANNDGLALDERGQVHPARPCTAPLKFTRRFFSSNRLMFGTEFAGSENLLDLNDRARVFCSFEQMNLDGSKYGVTCKGAAALDIVCHDVRGRGKECDVDLGGYSEQFPRGKAHGTLDLKRIDGGPIYVRVNQAGIPTLVAGSGPYIYVSPDPNAWWHPLAVEWFLLVRRNKWGYL